MSDQKIITEVDSVANEKPTNITVNVTPTKQTCIRCSTDILTGHAFELGTSRWHTGCFACYRCTKQLNCDSNFLVLDSGALLCFECSDSCKSCSKKIDGTAIILSSSNEAYCRECFTCYKCKGPITDLKYAKTKHGLFCLKCHEKLVLKRKQYDQKKRELASSKPFNTDDNHSIIPQEIIMSDHNNSNNNNNNPQTLNPSFQPLCSSSTTPTHVPQRSQRRPLSPYRRSSISSNPDIKIEKLSKISKIEELNHNPNSQNVNLPKTEMIITPNVSNLSSDIELPTVSATTSVDTTTNNTTKTTTTANDGTKYSIIPSVKALSTTNESNSKSGSPLGLTTSISSISSLSPSPYYSEAQIGNAFYSSGINTSKNNPISSTTPVPCPINASTSISSLSNNTINNKINNNPENSKINDLYGISINRSNSISTNNNTSVSSGRNIRRTNTNPFFNDPTSQFNLRNKSIERYSTTSSNITRDSLKDDQEDSNSSIGDIQLSHSNSNSNSNSNNLIARKQMIFSLHNLTSSTSKESSASKESSIDPNNNIETATTDSRGSKTLINQAHNTQEHPITRSKTNSTTASIVAQYINSNDPFKSDSTEDVSIDNESVNDNISTTNNNNDNDTKKKMPRTRTDIIEALHQHDDNNHLSVDQRNISKSSESIASRNNNDLRSTASKNSIDDILNTTLQDDEFKSDESDVDLTNFTSANNSATIGTSISNINTNNTGLSVNYSMEKNNNNLSHTNSKSLLNKTPLKNSESPIMTIANSPPSISNTFQQPPVLSHTNSNGAPVNSPMGFNRTEPIFANEHSAPALFPTAPLTNEHYQSHTHNQKHYLNHHTHSHDNNTIPPKTPQKVKNNESSIKTALVGSASSNNKSIAALSFNQTPPVFASNSTNTTPKTQIKSTFSNETSPKLKLKSPRVSTTSTFTNNNSNSSKDHSKSSKHGSSSASHDHKSSEMRLSRSFSSKAKNYLLNRSSGSESSNNNATSNSDKLRDSKRLNDSKDSNDNKSNSHGHILRRKSLHSRSNSSNSNNHNNSTESTKVKNLSVQKTKSNPSSTTPTAPTSPRPDNDTYTGWGVASSNDNLENIKANNGSIPRRIVSKGKSDSVINSNMNTIKKKNSDSDNEYSLTHQKSQSSANIISNQNFDGSINDSNSEFAKPGTMSATSLNVSMFRTPPLEADPTFAKFSNSFNNTKPIISESLNEEDEIDADELSKFQSAQDLIIDRTATNNTSASDFNLVTDTEQIRNITSVENNNSIIKEMSSHDSISSVSLKSEVRELQEMKFQLKREIDLLRNERNSLVSEINSLRQERSKSISTPSSRKLDDDSYVINSNSTVSSYNGTATTYSNSSSEHHPNLSPFPNVSRSNTTKPKFWKIFGSKQQSPSHDSRGNPTISSPQKMSSIESRSDHSNGPSISINSTSNYVNKVEISGPIRQNPRDINNKKLNLPDNIPKDLYTTVSPLPPSDSTGQNLYNSSLVTRCKFEKTEIPLIIRTCINYVELNENNLKTEGLYRKSGSQILIEQIERQFASLKDSAISPSLTELLREDIHAVAGVLKRYLRKLYDPIITFEAYDPLIKIVRNNDLINKLPLNSNEDNDIKKTDSVNSLNRFVLTSMTKIINSLPKEHYNVLKFLSQHLSKVASFSEVNLMTLFNLSVVFAPGLLRDHNGEKDITDLKVRNYAIGYILENHRSIFV
ncbi:hypothetical protein TBLA_0A06440 [Henningerozyma blattae CBS 6284]|uniref:RhoGAP-domain-containing protein n=1 Tax=Henningerozyma blattae (strain ATCC 34711 / CBS 6284 / DSM 70876 / NBRC 10599 / NRRL Y-10934 / UCD 77-7) TaxID=1071380 RepID=I2GWD4_HENB6|nr:hypothetical protein TBLA_0A06440 [Tetrapisispora blattae CBS 6284]CCH58436.1 hypothetical protein TBLA_0A06440 [Tetrapisispora blattae CBS 6284]